jgi:hypothetical protein
MDCAAASAASAKDKTVMGTKTRFSIMRNGWKPAKVNSDWIRAGTQLLYTAEALKCSGRCQTVNASLSLWLGYGFGLSAVFCCCCWASSVQGGTTPFTRA